MIFFFPLFLGIACSTFEEKYLLFMGTIHLNFNSWKSDYFALTRNLIACLLIFVKLEKRGNYWYGEKWFLCSSKNGFCLALVCGCFVVDSFFDFNWDPSTIFRFLTMHLFSLYCNSLVASTFQRFRIHSICPRLAKHCVNKTLY